MPDLTGAKDYLGDVSWTDDEITSALASETTAQLNRCRVPSHVDDTDPDNPVTVYDYPDDLTEALYRRVAHNLALRGLPLGVQASVTEAAIAQTRVGGTDAEVSRLEAPWRRLVVG